MKTILSLRKHHYLEIVGIFLIVVALVVWMVGCSCVPPEYDLTMAADPAAGGTATDKTNGSPYAAGSAVDIKAEANTGYQFVSWTAAAGGFDDAYDEVTTFTMPGQDVTVTANFEATPPDHFKWYVVETDTYIGEVVYLEDQFGAISATVVGEVGFLGNPVEKVYGGVTTPISNPDHHFMLYELEDLEYEEEPQSWAVNVSNQFGDQELIVSAPVALAVPTQKEGHDPPVGLDHFLLYEVIEGPSVEVVVGLNDQFGDETVTVYEPVAFANPVQKTHDGEVTEIVNPEVHWVLYWIEGGYFETETEVQVVNQFGEQTLDVYYPVFLAVPSKKISADVVESEPLAVAAILGDYYSQLADLLQVNDILAEERDCDVIYDIGDYDVVVVNEPYDPGATDFQAFLDAASDNGVGVVFTSSYSIYSSWGISLLEWYSGDPAGQSEDSGWGDVYYKVTQEHPIFDGWDVGDEIAIITGGDCDHAWFWDYSGDTIGEVGSADLGIQGDAVAVGAYGGSTHVLLASLGPQGDTNVPHWTDDAKTIFVNAVFYAAFEAVAAILGDYDSQLADLLRVNDILGEERDWDVIYDIGDYDVVVVNEHYDPGATDFQAFLDAASDNGVGVVFTSSWDTDSSWGISLLEWYSGDPAGQSEDYGWGDVYYQVTQEHPVFDGWDVGDEITIITGGDCDHAWFWDYSGDTIGEVGAADWGIQGDAVAVGVYGGSTHILLASLGPQNTTNVPHWTDDAKTIFVNAVFYAAGL